MRKIWIWVICVGVAGCLSDSDGPVAQSCIDNGENCQSDADNNSAAGSGNRNNGGDGNSNSGSGALTTSFSVSWTPPTENEDGSPLTDLDGYRIYFGTQSGRYTDNVRISNSGLSRYVVQNVVRDTYFVVMTAVNRSGLESDYTNEVAVMSD